MRMLEGRARISEGVIGLDYTLDDIPSVATSHTVRYPIVRRYVVWMTFHSLDDRYHLSTPIEDGLKPHSLTVPGIPDSD